MRENVLRYLRNSLIIAVPVTVLTLVLGLDGRLCDEPPAHAGWSTSR